jgi:5S rRNA maturation endonuclease (ribonuclease M5)
MVFINMVAPQFIRDYFLEKFKDNYKLSSNNDELIVPSVFIQDDWKRHLCINLESGLWQCFKSGNKGNFIQLYSYLEGMTYNQAEAEVLFRELDSPLTPVREKITPKPDPAANIPGLHLTEVTVNSHSSESSLVQKAWAFLYERKLFNLQTEEGTYYISTQGRYKNRLVIPFSDEGNIYYFQARSLGAETPKYLNPSDGWAKPSHILYPYDESADHLVICEGPLDAISLQIQGVNATCTMGSSVSEIQVEQLKEFGGKIIIGYDNDDAGKRGINKFDYLRRLKRMTDISICHPPSEVKDWNEAHIKGINLHSFVEDHTTKYDYDYLIDHLLTTL